MKIVIGILVVMGLLLLVFLAACMIVASRADKITIGKREEDEEDDW